MSAKCIMIQGTGSNVGKSLLGAALCRIFAQDGYKVAPFKAQNMSLNSYVTKEGGEMGRAQVVQAEAAYIDPHVDMNPILLKPTGDKGSQVILHGKPLQNFTAREYYKQKVKLWKEVVGSLERLRQQYEIIVIEGAGSPAEVNLKATDIVNMRVAIYAKSPVLLVGDIDLGGVFAWLVGTLELLTEEECNSIKGLIINKFRGDVSLLTPGLEFLEKKTGKPVLGVVPYFRDIEIEEEDSVSLDNRIRQPVDSVEGKLDIVVIRLPRISNFTDFNSLSAMGGVSVRYVTNPEKLGTPDAIILPGTKNTLADLKALRERGLEEAIKSAYSDGTHVIGICGGFQMLGIEVRDPFHVESSLESVVGLGLLNVITTMNREKMTAQARGEVITSDCFYGFADDVAGYEIHQGETELLHNANPLLEIVQRGDNEVKVQDGAISPDGRVWGTYFHGIFDNDEFRIAFANYLRKEKGLKPMDESENYTFNYDKQRQYDLLAESVRAHLDIDRIYQILRENG
jgi:adenosylcobyric acid synthase